MRVWLVEEKAGSQVGSLERQLRQLEQRPETELQLVGASPFHLDFVSAMRKLVPDLVDLIILQEQAWPEGPWTQELLGLGLGVVVVTPAGRVERFRPLAESYPVWFVAPGTDPEALWLALLGALVGRQRQGHWLSQLTHLQQRLQDRIVIERAKGILVQRLSISEDEAYKRLRLLSRRQRRQIRDIAQSLLDTQVLLVPEINGTLTSPEEPVSNGTDNPSPLV